MTKLEERIENAKGKITLKDDSKTVALGTSKINYMDPRISVAWCKRKDVPIEKVFAKTLLQKFPWAMEGKSFRIIAIR
jgi:DNA topoisomerase-1